MTKFARLTPDDGGVRTVIDIVDVANINELATRFHPNLVSEFIEVPDDTVIGSTVDESIWSHPDPVSPPKPDEPEEPEALRRYKISPPEFKMLFTSTERLTIRAMRRYEGDDAQQNQFKGILDDWFDIVDDPRLTHVDLQLPQTIEGVEFLVMINVLTDERKEEILTGLSQEVI